MHHLSRVGSRLGEGLTSGLNRITQEIASSTGHLAMQLMDSSAPVPSDLSLHPGPVRADDSNELVSSDFTQLSESIIKVVEEEIDELNREKLEYQEILKNLKDAQRKQSEAFAKAEESLSERYVF